MSIEQQGQQGIEVVASRTMVWMTIHQGQVTVPIRIGFSASEAIGMARALEEAAVRTGQTEDESAE